MYLRRLYVENSGPLTQLGLDLKFKSDGLPALTVLVGENGSGKTNLLSLVADALFEAAAAHYTDAVVGGNGVHRPWFRINGGTTTRLGATGDCALLQFTEGDTPHVYTNKSGLVDAAAVQAKVPEQLRPHVNWQGDAAVKTFSITDEQSKKLFEQGVYLYLPSSRAEAPNWLNRSSVPSDDFDLQPVFSKTLRKPIFMERGLEQLKQWLLGLLVDTRMDVTPVMKDQQVHMVGQGNFTEWAASFGAWQSMNAILCLVLNRKDARFCWAGRKGHGRIGITHTGLVGAMPLESLSAGQATLLNIFGTLLRYGDGTAGPTLQPSGLSGICVVDEIDAHMHIDLQHRALPQLMRMFPKIQFIVSSHSPLFVLGAEQAYGADELSVIDMPSGAPIAAEAYAEFGRALDALRHTQAFDRAVLEAAGHPGKLLVLLEGETDPLYLTTAATLLGKSDLLEAADFEWVGAKHPQSGQGFFTGKDSLDKTAELLRAKPDLVKRPILLLYDNDVKKPDADHPNFFIRSIATNPENEVVKDGIENTLSPALITADFFTKKTTPKRQGGSVTVEALDKMKLCKHLCEAKRDPADFASFETLLDLVAVLAPKIPTADSTISPGATVNGH